MLMSTLPKLIMASMWLGRDGPSGNGPPLCPEDWGLGNVFGGTLGRKGIGI
jgi:hypothetical protein